MTRFSFLKGEPALRACLEWAAVFDLEDVRKALGEQQLAAMDVYSALLHSVLLVAQPESLASENEAGAALCHMRRLMSQT
jgi:hypothetical protein